MPLAYPIVDTGQSHCYSDNQQIRCPNPGQPFNGQDAQHAQHAPSYRDNGDGTISDLNTVLIWAKRRGDKMSWEDAVAGAKSFSVGGYNDWRMPTIKELYSLIQFNGNFNPQGGSAPFIDSNIFEFRYGDSSLGEREIDVQDWSATEYVGTTMTHSAETVFGVNFADGRIKGYPKSDPRQGPKVLFVRYVRGNADYGVNQLVDSGGGIINDKATGLDWAQRDSAIGMNWQQALRWVEQKNRDNYLGHNDWRLPDAKELQSLVDYSAAPLATNPSLRRPAIDPLLQISQLEDGDYPFFWSSTTHLDGPSQKQGSSAVYIAFGTATGWMGQTPGSLQGGQMQKQNRGFGSDHDPRRSGPPGGNPPMQGNHRPPRGGEMQSGRMHGGQMGGQPPPNHSGEGLELVDVHGAGAQRSDPKSGDADRFPYGRGPQGDVIRIDNYVRLVRDSD
ncbi:MAG: DUF1566 domain-containing protein [Motiliproteus sp.]